MKPKDGKKYDWYVSVGGKIRCSPTGGDTQFVTKDAFLEARELTAFHDDELARLTREVNELFRRAESKIRDPHRVIGILRTPDGLFLVWSEELDEKLTQREVKAAVSMRDDPEKIREALKLKLTDK